MLWFWSARRRPFAPISGRRIPREAGRNRPNQCFVRSRQAPKLRFFEFHHRLYSDGNNSNDLAFSPVYEFALEKSQFDLGYSFNYRSFAMKANHGYYDPRRLISNGLTATWKFDRDGYYGNFKASEGHADIKGASGGLGAANSAMCTSVVATMGLRPREDVSVEGYWGGEWSAAWSSNALGFKIRYSF